MNLEWSDADFAFQSEVRDFLERELTPEIRAAGRLMTSVYAAHDASMEWQRKLHSVGWAAPAWPKEYGGCDWTVTQRYIYTRERVAAGAPPVSPMGIQMCGPALIGHGSAEQKTYFLPRMLSGEHFWCQGYSEPGSGSDLASLAMRADISGDKLVCNGSKIWTTHADVANWIFCLVRTSKEARPQQGITFVLIDMSTAGITVQPIISSSGEHIQNQVFFENVSVPLANVVGEIGKGWSVAKYLLEFERGGVAYSPELQEKVERIANFAATAPGGRGQKLMDRAWFVHQLAALRIKIETLEIFEFQAMARASHGGSPGFAGSIMKVYGTELAQQVTELGMLAAGHYGNAYQPQATEPGGAIHFVQGADVRGPVDAAVAPLRYLNERAGSIYAGSNEIQRNILAKAALSL